MGTDRSALLAVPAAAALLLWPSVWNGFPIVFADTGTYLSQAIQHYAGWDRPVFYSLFMLPLHATISVWPVVVMQALIAGWVLWLVVRALVPRVPAAGFVAGVGVLSGCTWLPWMVSELMPDLFTPLLVLVLCLLAWARLSTAQSVVLIGLAAFMIASQLSSLPLTAALVVFMAVCRSGAQPQPPMAATAGRRTTMRWLPLVAPPALAVLALCAVNFAAFGRFAIAPFGNVFLLARVIYDGPGMAALRGDCGSARWRLCPFLDEFPPDSDGFLWTPDSPLYRAGGPKAVARDAASIIVAGLRTDPIGEARAAVRNALEQAGRFASGDGLTAWPEQVSPVLAQDFPAREQAAYAAARQQRGSLAVPPLLAEVHAVTALAGVVGCVLLLPIAFRRRAACRGFLLTVLLTLPVSAVITGCLSAPHDRYQARVMWLPPFVAAVSLVSLHRRAA